LKEIHDIALKLSYDHEVIDLVRYIVKIHENTMYINSKWSYPLQLGASASLVFRIHFTVASFFLYVSINIHDKCNWGEAKN
jgi:hypothetical protein